MNGVFGSIAVGFLARGADTDWYASCERFLNSYLRYRPGIEHSLYIIFKGFPDNSALDKAKNLFKSLHYTGVFLEDNNFDIGAYVEWANQINEEVICVLNTMSEILTENWLLKFSANLALPNIGLVGATASYESLNKWHSFFPEFPNPHIRTNAFMINRKLFCHFTKELMIADKVDAFRFESGVKGMTRQVLAAGLEVLLVGRNGRGYSKKWWPVSDTFRQGTQSNLMVADNQTRNFAAQRWPEKRETALRTWGHFLYEQRSLR
jgi:hypothetical protein